MNPEYKLVPPLVTEAFDVRDGVLSRTVSMAGMSGISRVNINVELPEDTSRDGLTSIWDKAFLNGLVEHPQSIDATKVVRVADLFCGAGGLSYGVGEAIRACGLLPSYVLAADSDSVAMEVYRRNFDPIHFTNVNLWGAVTRKYSDRKVMAEFSTPPVILNDQLNDAVGKIDILIGGPPCEGHSSANNWTRGNDSRNRYYIVMPAMAIALGAKAVIIENVPGIQHDRGKVLDIAKGLFRTNGYHLNEHVVDLTALGYPQTRKRHILVASRTEASAIGEVLEQLTRPPRDLRWAIGDLLDTEGNDPMDASPELSDVNKQRIEYLFDNDEYDLPNQLRPDSHKEGHTYPSIYGRLRWNKPSGTITTGFNTPGRGRYIHPARRRTITAHEAARIQGFPDDFEFRLPNGEVPTRQDVANMIGDAVPPPLGFAVGLATISALNLGDLPTTLN